ncbi:sugar phosphate isomerase/epimerase family protein [Streptomyces zingiberis]|uniref:TIM barrel protein n=1 Tax=Streptomyces zingiberis TaxID=2053010 RepID=A0ABX1BR99_9ACTN|nr:TIM barrel protein [Streptomyces zingiberis]NJQ00261.1 TIM barrel protein [Streptomyces zingiberis]
MNCQVGLAEWRLPVSGAEALHLARTVGADGLQLDLGGPGRGEWLDGPGRLDAIRAAAECTGVRLLAVGGNHLNDVGLMSPAARPVLERLLDTAHALAVPLAFVPSFRRSGIDGPAALEHTAEVLAWAAAEAEARGLLVASENVLTGEQARTLVRRVASPAFRVLLDTFNPVTAGLACDVLVAELSDVLADQIHLKEGPPATGAGPPLGTGTGRLDDTLRALRDHGVPVRAAVLENDYRDGDRARLLADLRWARQRTASLGRTEQKENGE